MVVCKIMALGEDQLMYGEFRVLGTVIGIINAFQGLSTTAQLTLSSVAPGISEALVATAVGLLAAIPALIAYNQFSKKLDNLINGSLAFAEQLIIQINKK